MVVFLLFCLYLSNNVVIFIVSLGDDHFGYSSKSTLILFVFVLFIFMKKYLLKFL